MQNHHEQWKQRIPNDTEFMENVATSNLEGRIKIWKEMHFAQLKQWPEINRLTRN